MESVWDFISDIRRLAVEFERLATLAEFNPSWFYIPACASPQWKEAYPNDPWAKGIPAVDKAEHFDLADGVASCFSGVVNLESIRQGEQNYLEPEDNWFPELKRRSSDKALSVWSIVFGVVVGRGSTADLTRIHSLCQTATGVILNADMKTGRRDQSFPSETVRAEWLACAQVLRTYIDRPYYNTQTAVLDWVAWLLGIAKWQSRALFRLSRSFPGKTKLHLPPRPLRYSAIGTSHLVSNGTDFSGLEFSAHQCDRLPVPSGVNTVPVCVRSFTFPFLTVSAAGLEELANSITEAVQSACGDCVDAFVDESGGCKNSEGELAGLGTDCEAEVGERTASQRIEPGDRGAVGDPQDTKLRDACESIKADFSVALECREILRVKNAADISPDEVRKLSSRGEQRVRRALRALQCVGEYDGFAK
ncbi:MAG: hypothetical protein R3C59_04400 [Planctomycetaceae bacterium]